MHPNRLLPDVLMRDLSRRYPVWFVDIWGVVHNGERPFTDTVNVLALHRKEGGTVVLVSNSPRSEKGVTEQLNEIGVRKDAYDCAVTSGDVTQGLMLDEPSRRLFHLGPARDLSLFEGLPVKRVNMDDAGAIICTGLYHDDRETPDDYAELLAELYARKLPMISANPDKIVRKGDQLIYCAGALAEAYQKLGGVVTMAGKPHAPIYELALRKAFALRDISIERDDVLAIGDGPETDILGAANQGFPVVYVGGGVRDHVDDLDTELAHIRGLVPQANILMAVRQLQWV
jgi:HAD superfamily hydrolase (TIGR01459 family)